MRYIDLKPGDALIARNDKVGMWLVVGKSDKGFNMWLDLSNGTIAEVGSTREYDKVDLSFYELFAS